MVYDILTISNDTKYYITGYSYYPYLHRIGTLLKKECMIYDL